MNKVKVIYFNTWDPTTGESDIIIKFPDQTEIKCFTLDDFKTGLDYYVDLMIISHQYKFCDQKFIPYIKNSDNNYKVEAQGKIVAVNTYEQYIEIEINGINIKIYNIPIIENTINTYLKVTGKIETDKK